MRDKDYVLTPARYVALAEVEDDFDFDERMATLKAEFEEQVKRGRELDEVILRNLKDLGV